MSAEPNTVTWRAPNPLTADSVLDWMHGDICDEFDDAEDLADRMHTLGVAKRERLDELLTAAWAQFVDEAGLTELHTTDEEVPNAR